jgi:hypothetical protein
VFAISFDLDEVATTPTDPVVWAVGVLRDPAIQVVAAEGAPEQWNPYWRSVYGTPQDAVSRSYSHQCSENIQILQITVFLQDYDNAVQRANNLDADLARYASTISTHYADLVSITARQAMAGVELTVGGSDGAWNQSNIKMFMKDLVGTGPG